MKSLVLISGLFFFRGMKITRFWTSSPLNQQHLIFFIVMFEYYYTLEEERLEPTNHQAFKPRSSFQTPKKSMKPWPALTPATSALWSGLINNHWFICIIRPKKPCLISERGEGTLGHQLVGCNDDVNLPKVGGNQEVPLQWWSFLATLPDGIRFRVTIL